MSVLLLTLARKLARGGASMNERIKVCPYCPRYKNCPYSEYIDASAPVAERQQKAYECLTAMRADEHYEAMRENMDAFGVSPLGESDTDFAPISPDDDWELPF